MRLTGRDLVETLLAAAVVVVTLAVTQAWGWPLLGSYRSGVGVLAVLGIAMCTFSSSAGAMQSRMRNPFVVLATILGVVALGLVVAGLIAGTEEVFVALAITLLVLWLVSTVHHAVQGVPRRPTLGTR